MPIINQRPTVRPAQPQNNATVDATPSSTPTAGDPAVDQPPAQGLDAATAAHQPPQSGGAVLGGDPSAPAAGMAAHLVRLGAQAMQGRSGRNLFALNPSTAGGAVPLPQVLDAMTGTPQAEAAVEQLAGIIEGGTGVAVPEALLKQATKEPAKLLDMMQLSPAEMAAGLKALSKAHADGAIKDMEQRRYQLPDKVDMGKLDALDVKLPVSEPFELQPGTGLYRGYLRSDVPDDVAKTRVKVAEVFDRLARNTDLPANERFEASYNGGTFTRLDTFLDALRKDGHDVSVRFDHHIANFTGFLTKGPQGEWLEVPTPVFVRTGIKDDQGHEALLPSVHSEMVITIKSGPDTKGPGVDAELKWYQGVPNTGFFPNRIDDTAAWCGKSTTGQLEGDKAARAVELAGLMTDVIRDVAEDHHMYMSGYGITGVCNDSVAVLQQAMLNNPTGYPLLMDDGPLLAELNQRLSDKNRRDDPAYRQLREAVQALPTDTTPNASLAARALASIPWKEGESPFPVVEQARAILDQD